MTNLKPVEKKYFEDIFGMSSGYLVVEAGKHRGDGTLFGERGKGSCQ